MGRAARSFSIAAPRFAASAAFGATVSGLHLVDGGEPQTLPISAQLTQRPFGAR